MHLPSASSFHPLQPSMKRRCAGHDYRSRCMYMVTLVVEGRRHLLGHLEGDPSLPLSDPGSAHLVSSPLGEAVYEEWQRIPALYPQIWNNGIQLMPDHLHFIIFVREEMPIPLGNVIAAFKARCKDRYMGLVSSHNASQPPAYIMEEQRLAKTEGRKSRYGVLFETGFNDKILWHADEQQAWKDYLADNPRRRLLKQRHPDMFYVRHDVRAGGFTFEAMGNELLLACPRRIFVQCSRKLTDEDIENLLRKAEADIGERSVFISACVSEGEKTVMRRAFERRAPVVVLQENGFAQYEKPHGRSFDACCEGRMLLLAPWGHHNDRRLITREQCLALNAMAEAISTDRL